MNVCFDNSSNRMRIVCIVWKCQYGTYTQNGIRSIHYYMHASYISYIPAEPKEGAPTANCVPVEE